VLQSEASNLECARRCPPDRADENLLNDIYLFDRGAGVFTRLSGGPASWWAASLGPYIDATGRVVAFSSRQPIGPDDLTSDLDLFILSRDAPTGLP
jgi:hypothetical protein